MRDLQRRLAALGLDPDDEPGLFGPATADMVRRFQSDRGLRTDGVCGAHTWSALVEASWRLGDRTLYLTNPMLRGDDVAALQRRLGALGFDAGRVDAIFGPDTERALAEFQRNAGLVVDGICGPDTVSALARLGGRGDDPEPVVGVRERDALRRGPQTLAGRTVVVGEFGGLDALAREVARRIGRAGASVLLVQHPDGSQHATQANRAGAVDLYLGVGVRPDPGCATAFYRGHGWESPAGRRLAELVQAQVPAALDVPDAGAAGMAIPVLRETRMPAVVLEVGPPDLVVPAVPVLARTLVDVLARWVVHDEDRPFGTPTGCAS